MANFDAPGVMVLRGQLMLRPSGEDGVVQPLLPVTEMAAQEGGDPLASGILRYVSPDGLTQRPVPLEPIELSLPDGLQLSGKAILRLYVGRNGVVERVEIAESQLPSAYVDLAAQVFLGRRFSPGRIGNMLVPTFTEVEVEFNPQN